MNTKTRYLIGEYHGVASSGVVVMGASVDGERGIDAIYLSINCFAVRVRGIGIHFASPSNSVNCIKLLGNSIIANYEIGEWMNLVLNDGK